MFWTYGSLLVEYIKVHKKIETICWTFIKEKDFWYKKTTCPHAFLKGFKHIKGFSKHGEFSWKFWSCNFESIRIDFKFLFAFDILCSHGDFSNFQKIVFNDCPHIAWLFFSYFHPFDYENWIRGTIASLILKDMEIHSNLWSLWDDLSEKYTKTKVHH
jgi:hypothetical protein